MADELAANSDSEDGEEEEAESGAHVKLDSFTAQPQHHHHQHHHHHHTGCTSPAIATAVTTKEQQIQNPTVGKIP